MKHKVKTGDCVSSVAHENGHNPETIWNHAENKDLRNKRKDPNVLAQNDEVFVPPIRKREVGKSTNEVHKFVYKGLPAKLSLRILNDGEPMSHEEFTLRIGGKTITGVTDNEGKLRESIPPTAKSAQLVVGSGESQLQYLLSLGSLPPIDTVEGVKTRLYNLGYKVGPLSDADSDDFRAGIAEFEFDHKLKESGEVSEAFRSKLEEVYGR